MAHDLTTGNETEPVPYRENPDYNAKDGSPKFLPDEPHIGLSGVNDDAKPATYQTGIVRGGTTNPAEGQSGKVERIPMGPGEADHAHGIPADAKEGDPKNVTKVNPDDESLKDAIEFRGVQGGTNTTYDADGNAETTSRDTDDSSAKASKSVKGASKS